MTPPTCLVADDHPSVVRAVAEYLRAADVDVVGTARHGVEALAKIAARRPAVAVVDARMPRLDGIEIIRRAARTAPETRIVLYTGYADGALAVEALDAGARGIVLKDAPLEDLLRALHIVAEGGTYVDPALPGQLALQSSGGRQLTRREREVLRGLADGLDNARIGQRLFISPETVRTHVRKAMNKLGVPTRTAAVAEALRRGLID